MLGCAALVGAPAQAYPATVCSATVRPNPVVGGRDVTVRAKANKAVDWTIVLGPARGHGNTQTARGHGQAFTHVFHTPKVAAKRQFSVRVSCDGGAPMLKSLTLAPAKGGGNDNGNGHGNGNGNGSGLPGTGGPAFWLVLLAVALVAEGGRRIHRARRA